MKFKISKASVASKTAIATSDFMQLEVGVSDVYFSGLEPRIALDAAAGAELIDGALGAADVGLGSAPSAPPVAQSASAADLVQMLEADVEAGSASDLSRQIVFVDASIDNFDEFIAGLPSDIEAHVISTNRDGVSQIASTLAGRSDIEAIHIVSHGDAGALILGDSLVTAESIRGRYADDLAAIGASLTDGADLLIYGCDFAFGAEGEAAADLLASATGADVAASTDITGSEIFGGDWVLEYETGEIEADAFGMDEWEGKLNNTVIGVPVDGSYSFGADDFDSHRGGTTSTITIVALPRDGALTLNGQAVVEGQEIAAADLGSLLYTSPERGDINVDHRLYYTVDDDIGPNPSPPMGIFLDSYAEYTVRNGNYFATKSHLPAVLPARAFNIRAVPDGEPVIYTDTGSQRALGSSFTQAQVNARQVVVRYHSGELGEPVDGLVVEVERDINKNHFTSTSSARFRNDFGLSQTVGEGGRLYVSDGSRLLSDGIYAKAETALITRTLNVPDDAAYFETLITGFVDQGANVQVQIHGMNDDGMSDLLHDQIIANDPMMDIKLDVSGYETIDLVYRITDGGENYHWGMEKPIFTTASSQIVTSAQEIAAIDTRLLQAPPAGATWNSFELGSAPDNGALQLGGVDLVAGTSYQMSDLDNVLFVPNADTAVGRDVELFSLVLAASDGSTVREVVSVGILSNQNVPTSTDVSVAIEEGASHNFAAADFAFAGLDSKRVDELIVDVLPGAGTLTLNGVAVTVGQAIAVSEVDNLQFSSDLGTFGIPYNSFDFRVRDSAGTVSDTYTVTVDVYSRPIATVPSFAVPVGVTHAFAVRDFGFSDADGDAMGSIIVDAAPSFGSLRLNGVLVAAGQEITVEDLGGLTFDAAAGATEDYDSFSIRLGDEDGHYSDVTVVAIDIGLPPTTADNTVSTAEDIDYAFSTGDFAFSDGNAGDSLAAVRIDSLPASGVLSLGGVDVAGGQEIAAADIPNLVYSPPADAIGTGLASFTFSVKDNTGLVSDASSTMTVDVTSVEDAPDAADNTVSTAEDTDHTFSVADFGFSDVDIDSSFAAVIIDSLPASGTLILNGVAATAGQEIAVADIANLVYSPPANAFGTGLASFTFSVKDSTGRASEASSTITIDVTSVEDAPDAADNTVSTLENTDFSFSQSDFGFSDVDLDSTFAAVVIDALPTSGTLALNGVAVRASQEIAVADIASLIYSPPAEAFGTGLGSFTFSVKDSAGLASGASSTIAIDVTSVEDAPESADSTVSTLEDTDFSFSQSDFGFSDVDIDSTFAAVIIDSLPASGVLSLGGVDVTTGQEIAVADIANLVYSPPANELGTAFATFSFSVKDSTGLTSEASNTITIDVTSVEDVPDAADNTVSTAEDIDHTFSVADFGFSDVDIDSTFAAVIIDNLPASGVLSLNGVAIATGQEIAAADIANLIYSPPANAFGTGLGSFTFSVKDSTGLVSEASSTVTIDVTSVEDAPEGADNAVTTPQDTGYSFTLADFQYSDIDGNEFASVIIDRLPASGTLSLNGIAVTTGQEIAYADIEALSFTTEDSTGSMPLSFNYRLRDDGGTSNGGIDTSEPYIMNIAVEPVYELSATFAANGVLEIDLTADLATDLSFGASDSMTRNADPATAHIEIEYLDGSGQRVLFEAGDSITASQAQSLAISSSDIRMTGEFIVGLVIDRADGSRERVYLSLDVTSVASVSFEHDMDSQSVTKQRPQVLDYSDKVARFSDAISLAGARQDQDLAERGVSRDSDVLFAAESLATGSVVDLEILDRAQSNIHNMRATLAVGEDKLLVTIDDLLLRFGEGVLADGLVVEMLDGSAIPDWITITDTGEIEIDTSDSGDVGLVELRVIRKGDDGKGDDAKGGDGNGDDGKGGDGKGDDGNQKGAAVSVDLAENSVQIASAAALEQ